MSGDQLAAVQPYPHRHGDAVVEARDPLAPAEVHDGLALDVDLIELHLLAVRGEQRSLADGPCDGGLRGRVEAQLLEAACGPIYIYIYIYMYMYICIYIIYV